MKNKKKLNYFDIAIVGNGIMGSMLSYNFSKKKYKTVLIGPKKRVGSASTAAGAMLNVFGEIDHDIDIPPMFVVNVQTPVCATTVLRRCILTC